MLIFIVLSYAFPRVDDLCSGALSAYHATSLLRIFLAAVSRLCGSLCNLIEVVVFLHFAGDA